MASKAATTKLVDVLIADVKKTDGDKAIEAVQKTVKIAGRRMRSEIETLEDQMETMKDSLGSMMKNPNASAKEIITLQRTIKVAEADLAEYKELYESRF